jgi:hypothetical protein
MTMPDVLVISSVLEKKSSDVLVQTMRTSGKGHTFLSFSVPAHNSHIQRTVVTQFTKDKSRMSNRHLS